MVLNTITRILKRFLIKGQKYFKNTNLAALTENIEHIHLYYQLCNFNFVFFQDDVGSVITDISSISGDPGHIEDTPLASGIDPLVNRCTLCIIRPTMNNFYSHKLCILTQKKNTTCTQIIKYMC